MKMSAYNHQKEAVFMRLLTLCTFIAIVSIFSIPSLAQSEVSSGAENADGRIGYLHVTEPFANVYERLDPKSPLIRQAKKGEFLELVYNGESWHKVKIDGKIGWVEKKAGDIVNDNNTTPVGAIIFLLIIVAGAIVVVFLVSQKNRNQANVLENDL